MIPQERTITQLSRALAECERERDALKAANAQVCADNAKIILWCQGALKHGTEYEYRDALVVIKSISKQISKILRSGQS